MFSCFQNEGWTLQGAPPQFYFLHLQNSLCVHVYSPIKQNIKQHTIRATANSLAHVLSLVEMMISKQKIDSYHISEKSDILLALELVGLIVGLMKS